MALKINSFEDEYGHTSDAYFRIDSWNGFKDDVGRFEVSFSMIMYKDLAAKEANKSLRHVGMYGCFIDIEQPALEQMYSYLKTMPVISGAINFSIAVDC